MVKGHNNNNYYYFHCVVNHRCGHKIIGLSFSGSRFEKYMRMKRHGQSQASWNIFSHKKREKKKTFVIIVPLFLQNLKVTNWKNYICVYILKTTKRIYGPLANRKYKLKKNVKFLIWSSLKRLVFSPYSFLSLNFIPMIWRKLKFCSYDLEKLEFSFSFKSSMRILSNYID